LADGKRQKAGRRQTANGRRQTANGRRMSRESMKGLLCLGGAREEGGEPEKETTDLNKEKG